MGLNIKPVIVLSRGAGVFVNESGRMEMVLDNEDTGARIRSLLEEMKAETGPHASILEPLAVSDPADFKPLFRDGQDIDALLVYFLGVTPIEQLLKWQGPIIAFSGPCTPAMALYAVGEERRERPGLFVALDYTDIRRTLRIVGAKKALADTRVLMFGFPPSWHLRWYGFPDLERLRRRFGVEFVPVELRELIETVPKVDPKAAARIADEWAENAREISGPSPDHIRQSVTAYLAMSRIMEKKGAGAMVINCLEITQAKKFSDKIINPCMGMQTMRDRGIPAGCEMDIPCLLTMILLGQLTNAPAFLGNIVRADPEKNEIKLSHCILPTRMPGFDKDPLPYTLCDLHGAKGVTAYTHINPGQPVTLARARRNLERITASGGELTDSEDTCFCRNTLTIRVPDARRFVQLAEGNHHAMVFGDCLEDLEALCGLLDCEFRTV
ncbi:MAG: hypothetical protein JRK53_10870 [Deltaproteobacteria bacterium]|nr:hypothetical protein [Deltaproteobacteria bacterium]MBW1818535.1 hypothetical protein [Deltaproteobacteria bacterium]MBW2285245.1 hypothetical protein [Deltaproteobacteria bacterium]